MISVLEIQMIIPFEAIIKGESNDVRFEKFCSALLEKSEGISFVPTSKTYDMGRDAVSIRPAKGTHAEIVCCTIEKDIEAKVIKDAKRLAGSSIPDHVYYCYSLDLSEHKINQLTADFRSVIGANCGVSFLDAKSFQIELIDSRKFFVSGITTKSGQQKPHYKLFK